MLKKSQKWKEEGPEYYDHEYGRYFRQPHVMERFRGLARVACFYAVGNVLDLGCGLGFAADFVKGRYLGIDFSPVAIDYAKAHSKNPNAVFRLANISGLTTDPPESWDTILMLELLEHLEDPWAAIQRAMKLGRRIIVSVPRDMPGQSHVWPTWEKRDIQALLPGATCWRYKSWWLAVWDREEGLGRMPKVGVVSAGRQIGGAETLCVYFAEWLKAHGAKVWLYVGRSGKDQLSDRARQSGVRRVGDRELGEACRYSDAVFLYGTKLVGEQPWLAKAVNRTRGVYAYLGGFKADYIQSHHLGVGHYWAESEDLAEYFIRYHGVPRKKVIISPIPMIIDTGTEAIRPFPDAFAFGVVGRLISSKQVLQVIQAFRLLDRENCALIIVGDGHIAYRRMLQRVTKDMENVRWAGLVTDRNKALGLLKGLDCLVSASHWEGVSITLREAMMLGVPVVAQQGMFYERDGSGWFGGTRELVNDGETGLLGRFQNMGDLIDNMRRMVDDGVDRNRIAEAALRFIEDYNAKNGRRAMAILRS